MLNFGLALDRAKEDAATSARMEAALRNAPEDRKLRLGLQTARRRAIQSQNVLEQFARNSQIDLVSYRIERPQNEYPVLSVAESISSFQRAFVGIADALVNGPKDRAAYSREIKGAAALNFAYSFPGSQGIMFSIANDRDIFASGVLDTSVDAFRDFMTVQSADEARDAARHLGLAAVGQLYDWIHTNATWDNDVEYVWTRSDSVKIGEYIPRSKFANMDEILKSAVEPSHVDLNIRGVLVGLDVNTRRFHIVTSDDDDISGRLDDEFQQTSAVVGQQSRYRALVRETEKRFPATGKVELTYKLLSLEETD